MSWDQVGWDTGNFLSTASGQEYLRDTFSAFWKHLNDPKWFGYLEEVQRHWINFTSLKQMQYMTWELKKRYLFSCFKVWEERGAGRLEECGRNTVPWKQGADAYFTVCQWLGSTCTWRGMNTAMLGHYGCLNILFFYCLTFSRTH